MKATINFRLTKENPEGYPLHAVCEEPIDLRLRKGVQEVRLSEEL
jgi:hypothetical protein